jgi:hypothetical protein
MKLSRIASRRNQTSLIASSHRRVNEERMESAGRDHALLCLGRRRNEAAGTNNARDEADRVILEFRAVKGTRAKSRFVELEFACRIFFGIRLCRQSRPLRPAKIGVSIGRE